MASYGIPLIINVLLVSVGAYQTDPGVGWCHPTGLWSLFFWEVPLFLAFGGNFLVYLAIYFILHRRQRQTMREGTRKDKRGGGGGGLASKLIAESVTHRWQWKMTLFVAVYFVCWGPDIVEHITYYIAPNCTFW